jgi:hypothetical protein
VKATRTVAALFAAGCLGLAYLTSNQANTSGVFDRVQTPATLSIPAEDVVPGTTTEDGVQAEQPVVPETKTDVKPGAEPAKTPVQ